MSRSILNLSLILTLLFTASCFAFDGGDGTEESPYQISTPEHLISIGSNESLLDKHYIIVADVNMAEYVFTMAVIGPDINTYNMEFDGTEFTGTFDGGGYSILNLRLEPIGDPNNSFIGLFGQVGEEGQVLNLGIKNVDIKRKYDCYSRYMGSLAGCNKGFVSGCFATGSIGAVGVSIGGLIGKNKGEISSCYSSISVSGAAGSWGIGGLVGYNTYGNISNCYSNGSAIGGDEYVQAGGLVGYDNDGVIKNCYSIAKVIGSDNERGKRGLVGNYYQDMLENCVYRGNPSSSSAARTDEQMRTLSTYTDLGWDFKATEEDTGYWIYIPNEYPVLAWQYTLLEVPDLSEMHKDDVGSVIKSAGFVKGDVTYDKDTSIHLGHVINQFPVAGSHYPGGLPVHVNISLGAVEYPGGGTASNPYQVSTPEQLIYIGINETLMHRYFLLTDDIDMSSYQFTTAVIAPDVPDNKREGYGWEYNGESFWMLFDGNGYKIINLVIDTLGDDYSENDNNCYLGLFGQIDYNARLKNIVLENVFIRGGSDSQYLGSLSARNNEGTITGCVSKGTVTGGINIAGGLIGRNRGDVSYCRSECSVKGQLGIGGLIGSCWVSSNISSCYSAGIVSGRSYVGGLIGEGRGFILRNNYSMCSVTGDYAVGGLAGGHYEADIMNCYSVGLVNGNTYVGGLTGREMDIQGADDSIIKYSFWDVEISGQTTSLGGTGKTTYQMQMLSTFTEAGWDFDDLWWINDCRDYPKLSWQPFGDLNNDNSVDIEDLSVMGANWGMKIGESGVDKRSELSEDDVIDVFDLMEMVDHWLEKPFLGD